MNSRFPNPKSQSIPNYQIPIVRSAKFRRLVIGNWILIGHWLLVIGIYPLFAQENNQLVSLSKQIIEAKTNEELYQLFADLKDLYLKDNKYNELVEFLKSLSNTKKTLEPLTNYYTGFTRYHQLKNLEEKQSWDEYFANVNTYRDEITASLEKAANSIAQKEIPYVYTRLLLWQFHRDALDAFHEAALADLMNSVLEYARVSLDPTPIKDAADKLSSYDEKGKAKELYKAYADKLINSDIKEEELSQVALSFYKEANTDLAEFIYNVYIERIIKSSTKEKAIPVLIDIAKLFAYKDAGPKDEIYAESVFKKLEDIGTREAFNEELMYLRAFNLEKIKDYPIAKDFYEELLSHFPFGIYADKASYKAGIISTYVLRDIKSGRQYFEKLAQKETLNVFGILSLYQLGLLNQWDEDYPKAEEYYHNLLEKAGNNFLETVALTQERIKELDEGKSIEYNLKTFLDVSLKEESASFNMTKVDLDASLHQAKAGQNINIASVAHIGESGCMQVELHYLWSGDLGQSKPSSQEASFNTSYTQPGTKEINLVVVSPTGIVDRNIDMLDID